MVIWVILQLLREKIARHRLGTSEFESQRKDFAAHERETLVAELEKSKDQVSCIHVSERHPVMASYGYDYDFAVLYIILGAYLSSESTLPNSILTAQKWNEA